MTSLESKRIWLTGASSGIGRALAHRLSEAGHRVALSSRREQVLTKISGGLPQPSLVVPLDVTNREANHDVIETIKQEWGGMDWIILNAGISEHVDMESPSDFSAELVERVTRVNYLGMIYGVEASMPLLEESPDPYIVAMSSSASYGSLPRAEAYGASKAAIKYFFESLRYDLEPFGIDVSVICPGFVKTPLTDKNDFPMPFLISPDESARQIYRGMKSRTQEIHFPKRFTYVIKLINLLPGWLYRWLIGNSVSRL